MAATSVSAPRRLRASQLITAIDSLRRGLAGAISPADDAILRQERETAEYYRRTADLIQNGLPGAIARNPIFALADSVRARAAKVATLVAEAREVAGLPPQSDAVLASGRTVVAVGADDIVSSRAMPLIVVGLAP